MTILHLAEKKLIAFVLVDSNGIEVPGLGTTFSVAILKEGGADFVAGTGTKDEISAGWYTYELTAAETNVEGELGVKVTGAGVVQQNIIYQVSGSAIEYETGIMYCTLVEFKANFYPAGLIDIIDDTVIESKIEAVSRLIDEYCERHYYKSSASEKRYFSPEWVDLLKVGDLVSITTLKSDTDGDRVYETTWTTSDYDLEPLNASQDGKPYTKIRSTPNGDYQFPRIRKGVEIDGIWGWPAVPKIVKEACLLQTIRLFKAKDSSREAREGARLGCYRRDPVVSTQT